MTTGVLYGIANGAYYALDAANIESETSITGDKNPIQRVNIAA
jgi:hypothetical protein